tara:strand:+ start:3239 stop:3532 length:294 start_codon:yes stop_codon:yes gene_type:complete
VTVACVKNKRDVFFQQSFRRREYINTPKVNIENGAVYFFTVNEPQTFGETHTGSGYGITDILNIHLNLQGDKGFVLYDENTLFGIRMGCRLGQVYAA